MSHAAHVKALLATLGVNLKPNPLIGGVVNASNLGIAEATVSILNSSKTVVATAATDASGFYFFARTSVLKPSVNYTVKVTGVPKGFKGQPQRHRLSDGKARWSR